MGLHVYCLLLPSVRAIPLGKPCEMLIQIGVADGRIQSVGLESIVEVATIFYLEVVVQLVLSIDHLDAIVTFWIVSLE